MKRTRVIFWGLLMLGLTQAHCTKAQTPYGGTPHPVPGIIQAEDFDEGTEGVAYHSVSSGNAGGYYRQTDMDIYGTADTDGVADLYLAPNEWVSYTIHVAEAGAYRVELRINEDGLDYSPAILGLSLDGQPISEAALLSYRVSQGGNHPVDASLEVVVLPVGRHELRATSVRVDHPFRFNWLKIVPCALRVQNLLAGNSTPGFADATGESARFSTNITGFDIDSAGNVLIADAGNRRIRKVSPAGVVTTLAGIGVAGRANGPGNQAQFMDLGGLALDADGDCYVCEKDEELHNVRIRKIAPDGTTSGFYAGWSGLEPFTEDTSFRALAVTSDGRLLISSRATSRRGTASIHVLENGVLTFRTWSEEDGTGTHGPLNTMILPTMATGHSTTGYFLTRYWSYGFPYTHLLNRLAPDGAVSSSPIFSCDQCYSAYTGLAANPAGEVFLGYKGSIQRRMPDGTIQPVSAGTTFVGPLAAGYDGSVYGFQGTRLYRMAADYKPVHLVAFSLANGSVQVSQPGPYASNTVVQLTANPSPGLSLLAWRGDVSSKLPSISVVMDTSKSIEALFGAEVSTPPATGGVTLRTPEGPVYSPGTEVTLTAKPDAGYEFDRWSDGNTNSTRTLTVTTGVSLQPSFRFAPLFTLDAQVLLGFGGSLAITPEGPFYRGGTVVTLTALPAPGCRFGMWLDGDLTNPRTLTVSSNTTLFALFTPGTAVSPKIASAPKSATLVVGDSMKLSVSASGDTPLTYHWEYNGTIIDGATGPSFTIGSVRPTDAGAYTVEVRNPVGAVAVSANLVILAGAKPGLGQPYVSNGKLRLPITGAVGETYGVETSSDLRAWTLITSLANTQGTVTFEEPAPSANRFYRVLRTK